MPTTSFGGGDFEDAWIEGDDSARWRSVNGHAGVASSLSLLEVAPGCRLPRHTDSAEENVIVVAGEAEVGVGGERHSLAAGDVALVPPDVSHEVFNAGEGPLRFVALYAAPENVSTFEAPVAPGGEQERRSGG